ncbi:MAG: peptidylprolyl isomerase [Actinobacteria bacterium]|nr:MAG: peptidylprolyl isomerase [Actinomycetota bacterium]
MARASRLPVAIALVVAVAGCGGAHRKGLLGMHSSFCGERGKHVAFPILDKAKTYTATVQTNLGRFAFALDVKDSPCTTSSFASLARDHFYDGLTFHRIVPGFVIQGGDPNGNGSGGPGYTVVDTPPADASYARGVVAMAKTGAEPPGTSGSQFFVVTGADAGLSPDYALLGKVTGGLDVVERIGRLGNPQNEQPTRRIVIRRIVVAA